MKYSTVFALLSLVPAGRASGDDQKVLHLGVNDPCTGAGGRPGVCIATAACTAGGGDFISGACPGTPTDIKCCTKASCGTTGGDCRWASTCSSGSVLAGLCPGPANFKCCFPPNPLGNLPGLNAPQSMHSRVIISRVINMPGIANSDRKRACYVAMVTARQESSILVLANRNVADSYNYPYDGVGSDHDSVGIFQQRASWGTTRDRMDPAASADKFLEALKRVTRWQSMEIGQAAQAVQRFVLDYPIQSKTSMADSLNPSQDLRFPIDISNGFRLLRECAILGGIERGVYLLGALMILFHVD